MYLSSDGCIMSKLVELSGQNFNNLTVISRSNRRSSAGAIWHCQCVCGNFAEVPTLKLRNGLIKSCGCKQNDGHSNFKHGHSAAKTRTYRTWKEMRQRCMNPNSDKWKWYGGRGITICERWSSFEAFIADMGDRPVGKTLDRLDSDGNYQPDNCRWATPKEQATTNRGVFKLGEKRQ